MSHSPEHLNSTGCRIGWEEEKGRGVYASRPIDARTVVDISPVLLFTKDEYEEHGRHTALDHYTFTWPDGRMALALGLGSLFNHSSAPNVSFSLDTATASIRYTTVRRIEEGEELCIFYGHTLWFTPAHDREPSCAMGCDPEDHDPTAKWDDLAGVFSDPSDADEEPRNPYADGDPDEVLSEEDLPFTRIKIAPDDEEDEEDEDGSLKTVDAWVVDIPDPKQIGEMLKWIKQARLDTSFPHLKRIRRPPSSLSTLLLCPSSSPAPTLPRDRGLTAPYEAPVPAAPARTPLSLTRKSALWPTVYAPRRKHEPDKWTRGKARWAWEVMRGVVEEAEKAERRGELPIVACVPTPFEQPEDLPVSFFGYDTRRSTSHPLRHAVMDVVRRVADWRAAHPPAPSPAPGPRANGAHYLLTALPLFVSHEPCVMCAMALLHSRVRELYYAVPLARTGGAGGAVCVPALRGVNHRYGVGVWRAGGAAWGARVGALAVDERADA